MRVERCGDCALWQIMGKCPHEYQTKYGHKGPDARSLACQQFRIDEDEDERRQVVRFIQSVPHED